MTRVLIAGGGTAGHVVPGLAIADALAARGVTDLLWIGARRGVEAELVPEHGIELLALEGRGIVRSVSLEAFRSGAQIASAVRAAMRAVRRFDPHVAVSLGGYAAFAGGLGAVRARVPLVVAEQNARAGAVNRLLARIAKASAVPFPETDLPRAVVTGNPVRQAVLAAAAAERGVGRARYGVPEDRLLILAFAGSLGATRINRAIVGLRDLWTDRGDLAIVHILGSRDFNSPEFADLIAPARGSGLWYQAVEYDNEIAATLRAADLAVCRAGGSTVAELAVLGLPAVLVPLPIATRQHQWHNATSLVAAGAAIRVEDQELTAERLVRELSTMLDKPRLARMAEAARGVAMPDAAGAIADLMLEYA